MVVMGKKMEWQSIPANRPSVEQTEKDVEVRELGILSSS